MILIGSSKETLLCAYLWLRLYGIDIWYNLFPENYITPETLLHFALQRSQLDRVIFILTYYSKYSKDINISLWL